MLSLQKHHSCFTTWMNTSNSRPWLSIGSFIKKNIGLAGPAWPGRTDGRADGGWTDRRGGRTDEQTEDGRMDGRLSGRAEGRTEGGRTDGRVDGWADRRKGRTEWRIGVLAFIVAGVSTTAQRFSSRVQRCSSCLSRKHDSITIFIDFIQKPRQPNNFHRFRMNKHDGATIFNDSER